MAQSSNGNDFPENSEMTFIIATAIIVGVIAYGMGKLSVYAQLDQEHNAAHPQDPALAWEPRHFELWSKARENEVAAEREVAKLIPSLSLASIAGVVALGQLKIIGTTGVVLLIGGFFFPVIFCIANIHLRQSLCNERARRLREAFDLGQPMRRLPYDNLKHRLVSLLSKAGAMLFACALLLTLLALPAGTVNCDGLRGQDLVEQWVCGGIVQSFGR
jgi:hypothetical protein